MKPLIEQLLAVQTELDKPAQIAVIDEAIKEIEELDKLKAKLPKTADGVTVSPGTKTWGPDLSGEIIEWKWGVMPWYDTKKLQELFNNTYSTEQSAREAVEVVK